MIKISIIICLFLFLRCSEYLIDQSLRKSKQVIQCIDTIDYCSKFGNIKEIKEKIIKSNNNEDKVVYWCCKIQKFNNHQKDSLTTDSCLCLKRLKALYTEPPPDSYDVYFQPATRSKKGYFQFSPANSSDGFWLGGDGLITINDSCRILKAELRE